MASARRLLSAATRVRPPLIPTDIFLGAPELAVEVISPSESAADVERKVELLPRPRQPDRLGDLPYDPKGSRVSLRWNRVPPRHRRFAHARREFFPTGPSRSQDFSRPSDFHLQHLRTQPATGPPSPSTRTRGLPALPFFRPGPRADRSPVEGNLRNPADPPRISGAQGHPRDRDERRAGSRRAPGGKIRLHQHLLRSGSPRSTSLTPTRATTAGTISSSLAK